VSADPDPATSSRPRRGVPSTLLRIALWLVGAILVLIMLLIGLVFLLEPEDGSAPDLSDLEPRIAPDPAGTRAHALYMQAAGELDELQRDPGIGLDLEALLEGWDTPEAEPSWDEDEATVEAERRRLLGLRREILDHCTRVFPLVDQALELGTIRYPEIVYRPDADLHDLTAMVDLKTLLLARARARFDSGDEDGAFADTSRLDRMGMALEQGGGYLLHELVALSCREAAAARMRLMAARCSLPATDLARHASALLERPVCRTCLQEMIRGEARCQLFVWDAFATGELDFMREIEPGWADEVGWLSRWHYVLQPNLCKGKAADAFRGAMANLESPLRGYRPPPRPEDPMRAGALAALLQGNLGGDILLHVLVPVLSQSMMKPHLVELHRGVAALTLALRSYQVAHGELPPSLDELVPGHISSLPLDPLDHAPLGYSPEDRQIYSRARSNELPEDLRSWEDPGRWEQAAFVFEIGF
jgi:hypothetical protein